jgi:hypothetical protein
MEAVLEILAEVIIQLFGEMLLELGFHSMASVFERKRSPTMIFFGYCLWGAILGGISLWLFPVSFVKTPEVKIINLIITPIAVGGAMVLIGKWRTHKGQDLIPLNKFFYGFIFALSMALVRYGWAK